MRKASGRIGTLFMVVACAPAERSGPLLELEEIASWPAADGSTYLGGAIVASSEFLVWTKSGAVMFKLGVPSPTAVEVLPAAEFAPEEWNCSSNTCIYLAGLRAVARKDPTETWIGSSAEFSVESISWCLMVTRPA
jgi:hypothetical protein